MHACVRACVRVCVCCVVLCCVCCVVFDITCACAALAMIAILHANSSKFHQLSAPATPTGARWHDAQPVLASQPIVAAQPVQPVAAAAPVVAAQPVQPVATPVVAAQPVAAPVQMVQPVAAFAGASATAAAAPVNVNTNVKQARPHTEAGALVRAVSGSILDSSQCSSTHPLSSAPLHRPHPPPGQRPDGERRRRPLPSLGLRERGSHSMRLSTCCGPAPSLDAASRRAGSAALHSYELGAGVLQYSRVSKISAACVRLEHKQDGGVFELVSPLAGAPNLPRSRQKALRRPAKPRGRKACSPRKDPPTQGQSRCQHHPVLGGLAGASPLRACTRRAMSDWRWQGPQSR
jgi:hypothetical protein